MNIGFTGTRKGMSGSQAAQLMVLVRTIPMATFHHGACEGADLEAVDIVQSLSTAAAIAHPAGLNPLDRNHDIVAACDVLIAAPSVNTEQLRSGTWATVRYARTAGKPVIMLSR